MVDLYSIGSASIGSSPKSSLPTLKQKNLHTLKLRSNLDLVDHTEIGTNSVERAGPSPFLIALPVMKLYVTVVLKRQSRLWIFAFYRSFVWKTDQRSHKSFCQALEFAMVHL